MNVYINEFGTSTEDEESDYESDDEKREKRRELFRNRKYQARIKTNICNICSFKAKNETGLKTHIRKKHKENDALTGPLCT